MSQLTREEVEAFIVTLKYGVNMDHCSEFAIALAEDWLASGIKGDLEVLSINLLVGDIVKSADNISGKKIRDLEIKGEGVKVFYLDGSACRYHLNFKHRVFRT